MTADNFRPLSGVGPVLLRCTTDPAWLPNALSHFDEVLIDHAHCEKKAAANALSLLQSYPELPELPMTMARLAREESAHLAKVLELIAARGLRLTRDAGDPYAQRLQAFVRTPREARRLDRLLVAAVIEARSCERLALLARGLADRGDERLARFYRELAQSEDGHQALFVRLALSAHPEVEVHSRLEALLELEAQVIADIGVRAAIH
ncbi:MAG: tRNA-(ms[2]io[6]A)-hydroxylase [Myxococcaceae bacterium]|nr:tRNA-(ms[2]io[6]A)-hydroxylase [Myxococcaceae bacterium]